MDTKEAMTLRKGDRVVIWRGQPAEAHGQVIAPKVLRISWDDGERTWIHPDDMQNVDRES